MLARNSYGRHSVSLAQTSPRPTSFAGFHKQQFLRERRFMLSVPIENQTAADSMHRALVRLRGVLLFYSQLKVVVRYGTRSQLLDASERYKVNLPDLIEHIHKSEYRPAPKTAQVQGWVVHPEAPWLPLWNVVMLLLMLYSFLIVPYLIAFENVEPSSPWFYVDVSVDSLFFLDILLTLNLAFYDSEQRLITSRRAISLNYLRGMLLIDCVSTFPVYLVTLNSGSSAKSNSLIRFARITKLSKLFRALKTKQLLHFFTTSTSMQRCIGIFKRYDGVTRLLNAVNLVAILCHLMACMWFFSAKLGDLGPDTWVYRADLQDADDFTLYLTSFYWAITTLTTVGFGEINAHSSMEMLLAMIWMLFGVGFYSFVMGTLSSMMTGLDGDTAFLETRLQTVDLFAKDTNLPKRTVKQISGEIRSITEGIILTESQRLKLVRELSRKLRTEVVREMYGGAADVLEVLKGVNTTCLARVMTQAERRSCAARTQLYAERDAAEHVFFLLSGRVRLIISKRNLVFKTIVSGSFFGESEVLENGLRDFTAEAETLCDLLILAKDVFLEILEKFPDIKSKVTDIRDFRKAKDKERMTQLVDLLEAVEIRKEVTFRELAGSQILPPGSPIELLEQRNTTGKLQACIGDSRELVEVNCRQEIAILVQKMKG